MTKTCEVLITRPKGTEAALCQKIRELQCSNVQFKPVVFPGVEIIDVDFSSKTVKEILSKISVFDSVIFISPVAIQKFCSLGVKLPPQIQIYCMGADSFLKIQTTLSRDAIYPPGQYHAAALLALKELQRVQYKHFLICEGKGGKDLIHETLKKRGAHVTSLILYERCLPISQKLPDLDKIDVIVCTSAQSLKNLIQLFGEPIKNKRFLLSSERLSLLGKELGLKWPSILAKHAGDEGIVEALQSEAQTLAN